MPSSGVAAPHAAANRVSAPPSSSARAQASRINGAKSRGPKTPEGKARVSQNALKHGFCAKKFLLMPDDSPAQFAALQSALLDELAPEGALQTLLAHRLISAAWRLARADRLEFELFRENGAFEVGIGLGLIRDGNSGRGFPTLVRYRGGAQAELFRTLKTLKALQSEDARDRRESGDAPDAGSSESRALVPPMPKCPADPDPRPAPCAPQDAPERRTPAQECDTHATRNEPEPHQSGQECDTKAQRNEPELEATPDGPGARPSPAVAGPSQGGEVGGTAGRGPSPGRSHGPTRRIGLGTASTPGALAYGDCTPRALR